MKPSEGAAGNRATGWPVAASSRTVSSPHAMARQGTFVGVEVNARRSVASVSFLTSRHSPLNASHTRTVLSLDALASRLPSGKKHTLFTPSVCPWSLSTSARSNTRRGRPIGFPVRVPFNLALRIPALTLSRISSRSNCAIAARICSNSFEAGLLSFRTSPEQRFAHPVEAFEQHRRHHAEFGGESLGQVVETFVLHATGNEEVGGHRGAHRRQPSG